MDNFLKEVYEGKIVEVYAPFGGRLLSRGKCYEVVDNDVICMEIDNEGTVTSYYLSDGVRVEVVS